MSKIILQIPSSARYQKMDKDFSVGKNVYFAQSVKELKDQLSRPADPDDFYAKIKV